MNKFKDKEDAVNNYIKMIKESWTYARLTDDEKKALLDTIEWGERQGLIKGNFNQRWNTLQLMYHAFVNALGYKPSGWRGD